MFRRRLTFANVVSFLALFVSLSAGSYAALKLPANSVGSKQIKAGAVTNAKLGSNAVSAANIAANAIDGSKVADGSLTGSDINLTTLGKVSSAAAADSAPIARVKMVTVAGTNRPATGNPCPCPVDVATVNCDAGLVVVGGGASVSDATNQVMNDSYPGGSGSWTAHVTNYGTGSPGFTVYAICAPAASTQ